MTGTGGEDVEYESDPEETKLSLKMRRREASDDEDEGGQGEESGKAENSLRSIDSDNESEGQGAPAVYEEDEDEEEYVEEEEELCEEVEVVAEETEEVVERGRGSTPGVDDRNEHKEEEKKENEPYAVPKAGAFYMHDDRFGDNVGGRNKRMSGGRRLWESKDDRKWGHDKYEELTVERNYDEGRRISRGRYRGRGRIRGADSGASRGRRPKVYNNGNDQTKENNQNIQNNSSKAIRGRGPRRYRPSFKVDNIDTPPSLNKPSGQSVDKPSLNSTNKASTPVSDFEKDAVTAAKQRFMSRLNYASPPFYPSSSSSKETTITHKREMQTETSSHSVQPSLSGESTASAQSTAIFRKDPNDSLGINKLNIDDSIPAVAGKPSSSLQLPLGLSSSVNSTHSQALRGQGRGFNASPHRNHQSPVPNNQVNSVSLPNQLHPAQQYSAQSRGQPFLQITGQQLVQQPGTGSQVSSPPKTAQAMNTYEPGELEFSSESNKLTSSMVGKGKGSLQGPGRGYGAHIVGAPGNMGSGHSNQKFSGTPTFLPVMQFGGQHPGGVGVPAVGMAFPGYVAQPHGLGNSEMTWLPVLAGAAGALGTPYCSPYIAPDGAYHPHPSGQISSLGAAPIKENNTSKPNSELKPQQMPELTNDDFRLRQKNPRRYTEMKFDQ
ncbi:hypothetical protein HAX54_048242 [Datura stramonium]|uniref:Btz domain-containing protein n=1 Tax=Datura stramonium TaxID=4076 RepID=A0ABS8WLJ5_DATST|nr:hypothetical protein [Datura stramonium]